MPLLGLPVLHCPRPPLPLHLPPVRLPSARLPPLSAQVLAFLASEAASDPGAVLSQCMRLGEVNFRVMALLDKGHTSR